MSNGMYMGGVGMGGEQSVDIRNLANVIEEQGKIASEGYGQMGVWDLLGDFVKTAFPGAGHVADLFIDSIAQNFIDIGDPYKIEQKETIWTEGQAKQYSEKFKETEKAAKPSFVENLLSELTSYAGTEVGADLFAESGDWLKNLFKSSPEFTEASSSWATAKEGGKVPKYKGGGTILDYFAMKGKSLGGSNKQSLAEILGRK